MPVASTLALPNVDRNAPSFLQIQLTPRALLLETLLTYPQERSASIPEKSYRYVRWRPNEEQAARFGLRHGKKQLLFGKPDWMKADGRRGSWRATGMDIGES